jgi:hypothetical protein
MSSATQEKLVTPVRKFLQDTTFCHCMFIINNRMKVTTIEHIYFKKDNVLWRTKNFERLVIPLTYKCKTGFMVN